MIKKQKPYTLKEFLDYIHHRMHPRKRHAFEKQMQKDPFMQDAMEGLAMNSEQEAIKRIQKLNDAILNKPQTRNSFYLGRIAAGLALLIAAGGVLLCYFWFTNLNSTEQLALEQHQEKTETSDIQVSPPAMPSELSSSTLESESEPKTQTPDLRPKAIDAPQKESPATSTETLDVSADTQEADYYIAAEVTLREESNPVIAYEQKPVNAGESIKSGSKEKTIPADKILIRGVVVYAEDQSTIPGVQIIVLNTPYQTITDFNGRFEIVVPKMENLRLQANFVGLQPTTFIPGDLAENKIVMQSDLATLQEVVVVGHGSSPLRSAKRTLNAAREGIKSLSDEPEPVIGHKAFKEYLEKNAFLPEGSEKSSATVSLSLRFNKAGLPVYFEVISSPGEIYTHTAIKVIEKGGIWHIPNQSRNIEDYPAVVKVVLRKRK